MWIEILNLGFDGRNLKFSFVFFKGSEMLQKLPSIFLKKEKGGFSKPVTSEAYRSSFISKWIHGRPKNCNSYLTTDNSRRFPCAVSKVELLEAVMGRCWMTKVGHIHYRPLGAHSYPDRACVLLTSGHFLWESSWPTSARGCVCMWRRNSRFGECLVQQSQWGPTMRNFRNLERACVFLFIRKKTHDCGRYSSHWYVGGCVSKSQKRLGVIWSRCFLSQTVLKVLRIDPLEVRATPPCKPVSHNYQHYIFFPGQS